MMETSTLKLLIIILIFTVIRSENLPSGSKCETFDSSEGTCVSIDRCKILREQLKKGLIERSQVSVCNNEMRFVCCKISRPIITHELNRNDRCKLKNFCILLLFIRIY